MKDFLLGVLVTMSFTISVFFLKFWRQTRDRLFLMFSIAFAVLATNWGVLAAVAPALEQRHYLFLLRLVAFVLIGVGIVDKNRGER